MKNFKRCRQSDGAEPPPKRDRKIDPWVRPTVKRLIDNPCNSGRLVEVVETDDVARAVSQLTRYICRNELMIREKGIYEFSIDTANKQFIFLSRVWEDEGKTEFRQIRIIRVRPKETPVEGRAATSATTTVAAS